MNLTLEALRILDEIDRRGSFAAAATALDRVPSALTYSVRKLEDDLDVLLFDRRGHRARLTAAGEELLTQGRHLLRAADELEQRVKRAATGWETELRIVVDSVIPFERMLPLVADFDREECSTRLRFSCEVLSGVWEALLQGRADLAIGAAYEGPDAVQMNSEYKSRALGRINWVFAVAPTHPLAREPDPLPAEAIRRHRAIAVGDTGRTLPDVTAGLLSGQHTLTVPTLEAKLAAQLANLGCGHLPRALAASHLASGALVEKDTAEAKPGGTAHIAWRASARGKALQWFLDRLAEPATRQMLLGSDA
ncbi:LysR family transcriptional regulator [Noviherbaspirillum pedocola]|uniref:LysR family transcriptional regulator n=1 Tax=Noviherbaspirillum pedocola TaxID=2801341 RepID=A0A934SQK3_9BURK|nr:LysR family transcriptional regulator [Noviherbaspirillum pedocola]MBK4733670.1 LysR family transcriptional regulator [Noviherbaspirillum pedocola]